MRIYLAGTPGTIKREIDWEKLAKKRLLSYWDIQQDQFGVVPAFMLICKKKRTPSINAAAKLRLSSEMYFQMKKKGIRFEGEEV